MLASELSLGSSFSVFQYLYFYVRVPDPSASSKVFKRKPNRLPKKNKTESISKPELKNTIKRSKSTMCNRAASENILYRSKCKSTFNSTHKQTSTYSVLQQSAISTIKSSSAHRELRNIVCSFCTWISLYQHLRWRMLTAMRKRQFCGNCAFVYAGEWIQQFLLCASCNRTARKCFNSISASSNCLHCLQTFLL